jgi:hypothetical protein
MYGGVFFNGLVKEVDPFLKGRTKMRNLLTAMLVALAMPMVASGTVLLDEDFDGVGVGTSLDALGFEAGTGYTVSGTTIDSGNSAAGGGDEAAFVFNHTLSGGQHYQIDATFHGVGGPSYFWAQNAAGNTIFMNHFQAWGPNWIEFQSQAPAGVNNTQQLGFPNPDPRTWRLEIFEDTSIFYIDPDGSGGWAFVAPMLPGEEFGFTDLERIRMTGGGGTFYDSILVQVIPEPASMGLIAMGALAMLRRRRAM